MEANADPLSVVTIPVPMAIDPEGAAVTVTHDAPNGLPLGISTIMWTATDTSGNNVTFGQTVNVVDTTPPVLWVPPNKEVSAHWLWGTACSVDIGEAMAEDIFNPIVINNPWDESACYLRGTYTVLWTATDRNGNRAFATQNVKVK